MIALDTNVLVRAISEDDAAQTAIARRLIERAISDGAALYVPAIVLCETVWVLRSSYGHRRARIAAVLMQVLAAEQLAVENREEAERALRAYQHGPGDFADLLIRERAATHGAHAVATFDRVLHRVPGFVDPDPAAWPDDLSLHERPPAYRRPRLRRGRAATGIST